MSEQYIDLDKFNQPIRREIKQIVPTAKTITLEELDVLERRKVQPTAEEKENVLKALYDKVASTNPRDIIQ